VNRLKTITQTCFACPSQWEGETEDGRPIYIRYRWGCLSVRIGAKGSGILDAVEGTEIFGKQIDKTGWDGAMLYSELQEHTKEVLQFPDKEARHD
jgi:hypothetical protein